VHRSSSVEKLGVKRKGKKNITGQRRLQRKGSREEGEGRIKGEVPIIHNKEGCPYLEGPERLKRRKGKKQDRNCKEYCQQWRQREIVLGISLTRSVTSESGGGDWGAKRGKEKLLKLRFSYVL